MLTEVQRLCDQARADTGAGSTRTGYPIPATGIPVATRQGWSKAGPSNAPPGTWPTCPGTAGVSTRAATSSSTRPTTSRPGAPASNTRRTRTASWASSNDAAAPSHLRQHPPRRPHHRPAHTPTRHRCRLGHRRRSHPAVGRRLRHRSSRPRKCRTARCAARRTARVAVNWAMSQRVTRGAISASPAAGRAITPSPHGTEPPTNPGLLTLPQPAEAGTRCRRPSRLAATSWRRRRARTQVRYSQHATNAPSRSLSPATRRPSGSARSPSGGVCVTAQVAATRPVNGKACSSTRSVNRLLQRRPPEGERPGLGMAQHYPRQSRAGRHVST
jgi:hypothetical protein